MNLVRKYIIKTGVKYGITGSIIIVLFYAGLLFFDKNIFLPALLLLAGLMIILIILFSIIEYNQIDIAPKFWKYMSVGIVCNFIISLVFFFSMVIIIKLIRPELRQEYVENRTAMMMEYKQNYVEKFGEAHFNLLLDDVKNTSDMALALDGPMKASFSGFFFVILFSLVFYLIRNKSNRL